jgi:hypothetical protein
MQISKLDASKNIFKNLMTRPIVMEMQLHPFLHSKEHSLEDICIIFYYNIQLILVANNILQLK